ncbi:TAXI family TRAP transporter solute-binding subunit [Rhodovarius lipocyclicus]|uniref:TAXI family TRAP transporter solute-binding subunit n=1 Tax=Rhodovarius lipocyclicus TaxID=268410 RepID=UPI001356F051|nr:TAXI family TRAP transporter solute-binding subunit [Rhodovarius lipocyclicus]
MTSFPPLLTRRHLGALTLATGAGAAATPAHAARFINVGAGHSGGAFFPVGVAVVAAISASMPDVRAQVQQTGGSHENIQLVLRRRAEFGLALADALSAAVRGTDERRYPRPLPSLRGVAALFPSYVHLAVRADSGIRTLQDLRGKRITVGAAGGGTESNARTILAAAGISFADLGRIEFLSGTDSADAIRDRRIDGLFLSTGLGASALVEIGRSIDLRFVPIPAETITAIGDAAYILGEVPAGTYQAQGLPAPTAIVWTHLFCDASMPNATVTQVLEAIFANLDPFRGAHGSLRSFSLQRAVQGMPIAFHDAARDFFVARGITALG